MVNRRPDGELGESEQTGNVSGMKLLPAVSRRIPATGDEVDGRHRCIEEEDTFMVNDDLQGLREEDVGISVVEGTALDERRTETEGKTGEDGYYYSARAYGGVCHSVAIPVDFDAGRFRPATGLGSCRSAPAHTDGLDQGGSRFRLQRGEGRPATDRAPASRFPIPAAYVATRRHGIARCLRHKAAGTTTRRTSS